MQNSPDGGEETDILNLNTALAQVLAAQGGGNQSLFLPGVGQQLNGDWLFPHGDALGSVRHVTGAAGNVLGTLRYCEASLWDSPFGERVESTGVLPFLGFCEASFRARVSRSSPPATSSTCAPDWLQTKSAPTLDKVGALWFTSNSSLDADRNHVQVVPLV